MINNKIVLGYIGNGKSTNRYHLPFVLKRKDKFIVKTIYNPRIHHDVWKKIEYVNYTENLDDVLNDPEIDMVVVCTSHHYHYEYTKKVLEANKFIRNIVPGNYSIIINGTGSYKQHSSIADCGTTGRKLAVDFYGRNCKIGGGSPWTKDGSKADLTLNLLARKIAKKICKETGEKVETSIACCIGKQDIIVTSKLLDGKGTIYSEEKIYYSPLKLITDFNLDQPIYTSMCRWGLFGEFQNDKKWER